MGLGVGLILAAVGAVLAFAVDTTVSGVNIHTVGWASSCRWSSGPRGQGLATTAVGAPRMSTKDLRVPARRTRP